MAGTPEDPIDPRVRIGHVHLKVSDLGRSLDFYCGILGFELITTYGDEAAFIAAGGYHHHIGLNTWESAGGSPPPSGSTGLFHLAVLYPDRHSLADALGRLERAGWPLTGASMEAHSEGPLLQTMRLPPKETEPGESSMKDAPPSHGSQYLAAVCAWMLAVVPFAPGPHTAWPVL